MVAERSVPLTVLVSLATLHTAVPSAWAQKRAPAEQGGAAHVVVLPFAAAERRMAMYGKPVADAVASALRTNLASASGAQLSVQAISLSGAVPTAVQLVIDGRIVPAPSGGLSLEARVRDPERGVGLATLAGQPGQLTDIDQLAKALGADLAKPVARALLQLRERAPKQTAATVPADSKGIARADAGRPGQTEAADAAMGASATGATRPSVDTRPVLVVFGATGTGAGGSVVVADLATAMAVELATRLGYRPVRSSERGLAARQRAVAELRVHGASKGLLLEVRDIAFSWHGVLAGRGRFRAMLIDERGVGLYDRVRRTATLVGDRGDGHRAVARLVLQQMADILRADLRAHDRSSRSQRPADGPGVRPGARR